LIVAMKFPEEDYAKRLHDVLERRSMFRTVPFRITVCGAGVNWRCEGSSDNRTVVVHCFNVKQEPEYYAEFRADGQVAATARTPTQHQVVAATFDWLEGKSVAELHAEYQIVDGHRRALEAVEDSLLKSASSLANVSRRMQPLVCDLHELWFESGDRDVKVSFYGKSPTADFTFRWDQCAMSETRLDNLPMVAQAIESWLVRRASPAEMRRRFPAIAISKVADFYAEERPIEGEFLQSWDKIEEFYKREGWRGQRNAASFVAALRHAGYDHTLRAGQSMFTLMVSRSRRHGLRNSQPHIQFWFSDSWIKMASRIDSEQEAQFQGPTLNPTIVGFLDRLAALPIN
jgi:hypothetical protein